jgi:uncharacterized protein YaaN involved in tellurite resistance
VIHHDFIQFSKTKKISNKQAASILENIKALHHRLNKKSEMEVTQEKRAILRNEFGKLIEELNQYMDQYKQITRNVEPPTFLLVSL